MSTRLYGVGWDKARKHVGGGTGSRCQNCMTVSVKQGENEGGGSSGWLQGKVRERRCGSAYHSKIRKDTLVGKRTKTHAWYS